MDQAGIRNWGYPLWLQTFHALTFFYCNFLYLGTLTRGTHPNPAMKHQVTKGYFLLQHTLKLGYFFLLSCQETAWQSKLLVKTECTFDNHHWGMGCPPPTVCILSRVFVIVFFLIFVYYLKSPISIRHRFAVHYMFPVDVSNKRFQMKACHTVAFCCCALFIWKCLCRKVTSFFLGFLHASFVFAEFITDIMSSKSHDCVAGCLNFTSLIQALMSLLSLWFYLMFTTFGEILVTALIGRLLHCPYCFSI